MWQFLSSLIGGPIVKGALDAYRAKLAAGNTTDKLAADLAQRELAVQQAELEAQNALRVAEIGHWAEPDKLMAYVVTVYFAKLLVWDKVLGLGSTDPLAGWAAVTANLIVASYFGKRGIENVVKLWRRGK